MLMFSEEKKKPPHSFISLRNPFCCWQEVKRSELLNVPPYSPRNTTYANEVFMMSIDWQIFLYPHMVSDNKNSSCQEKTDTILMSVCPLTFKTRASRQLAEPSIRASLGKLWGKRFQHVTPNKTRTCFYISDFVWMKDRACYLLRSWCGQIFIFYVWSSNRARRTVSPLLPSLYVTLTSCWLELHFCRTDMRVALNYSSYCKCTIQKTFNISFKSNKM